MSKPISDYALLSNCRISALLSCDASIDWLCLPEPDGPPVFWSILDDRQGGFWRIRARDVARIERRYLSGTMAIETLFHCASGTLRLTDLFQLGAPEPDERAMEPDHELTRRIDCLDGEVEFTMELTPRPHFGATPARFRRMPHGFDVDAGNLSVLIASDMRLDIDGNRDAIVAEQRLGAGQTRWAALGHTMDGPQVWPMIGEHASRRMDRTLAWWRDHCEGCSLPEDHTEDVARSALTLQAMTYPPTGAVVAAPTTSLPEELGGERNWDYRYCWIRDASFTMRAMLNLGNLAEAGAFFSWLLYATRLTWPRLRVMYDVHGRAAPPERNLEHIAGYEGSKPVRVGNGARRQLQLDTYGALLDAAWQYYERGGEIDRGAARMLRGFVNSACKLWRRPDAGIWEVRCEPRHHTLSKAMCWVAMDRGLRLAREGRARLDQRRLEREMAEVAAEIRERGFNREKRSYTATLDGDWLDASLLLLSIYGFEDPASDRMLSTIDRIYDELGDGGAIYRYLDAGDGVSGKEGRFGICGFWGVEALANAGRIDEAAGHFEDLMAHANDAGLFAEEIDTRNARALGNFPQALTHVGVINAARALARARNPEQVREGAKEGAR